jgi:hypothetical protein
LSGPKCYNYRVESAAQAAAVLEAPDWRSAEARRTQVVLAVGEASSLEASVAQRRRDAQQHLLAIAHVSSDAAAALTAPAVARPLCARPLARETRRPK